MKAADIKARIAELQKAAQSEDEIERADARRLLAMLDRPVRDADLATAREAVHEALATDGDAWMWTKAVRIYREWTSATVKEAGVAIEGALESIAVDAKNADQPSTPQA